MADAAGHVGMGHVARCTAVACALGERGVEVKCLGFGAEEAFELDGVSWVPLAEPVPADLVDSYLRTPGEFGAWAAFADEGDPPPGAKLVIGPVGLAPPKYACLRRAYWTPPGRAAGDEVGRVVVSLGAATSAASLADRVGAALPEAEVRRPHGLPTLRGELEAADLVVCAAGQTMLEALATARPVVAVVTAENQRAQADALAGAVVLAEAEDAPAAAAGLAADHERRRRLAVPAVDGQGAHRVAEALLAALE